MTYHQQLVAVSERLEPQTLDILGFSATQRSFSTVLGLVFFLLTFLLVVQAAPEGGHRLGQARRQKR